jgi:hypothetical protein
MGVSFQSSDATSRQAAAAMSDRRCSAFEMAAGGGDFFSISL